MQTKSAALGIIKGTRIESKLLLSADKVNSFLNGNVADFIPKRIEDYRTEMEQYSKGLPFGKDIVNVSRAVISSDIKAEVDSWSKRLAASKLSKEQEELVPAALAKFEKALENAVNLSKGIHDTAVKIMTKHGQDIPDGSEDTTPVSKDTKKQGNKKPETVEAER